MKGRLSAAAAGVLLFVISCTPVTEPEDDQQPGAPGLREAFPNLTFNQPLDLQHAGDGSNRLFVVEQGGKIWVFENDSTTSEKREYLDISDKVIAGGEQGLLGLAFHPNYSQNGLFYVNYTTGSGSGRTIISEFQVQSADPNTANRNSERILLDIQQPAGNHNGGQLAFNPMEADQGKHYLYIALGDGGGGGDTYENGQNLTTLLGTISRIDVDGSQVDGKYGIPPENPYSSNTQGFRRETFAFGLRNPWRFSFDPETGDLWIADVGQNQFEEINFLKFNSLDYNASKNYGWPIMEGFHCFNSENCNMVDLIQPVWEYNHEVGNSITGGYVYRGTRTPSLLGKYIYADYVSGLIWTLDDPEAESPSHNQIFDTNFFVSSFGIDENNEIYVCGINNGKIYRF